MSTIASQVFLLLLVATLSILLVGNRWLGRRGPQVPGPGRIEEKPAKYDKTFRVRGVPREWDSARLRSFLEDRDPHLTVKSLAREIHCRSSSGTVACRGTPAAISIPLDLTNSPEARLYVLTLDDDFVGMTTLFAPPDEDHMIDVVAISGLGGHAFGSFKERGGEHMWLRDALPYDLKSEATERHMARVMTYGYGSAVAESQNTDNLEDLATAFHSSLLPLVSSAQTKPIIFIAHSLGGLILKQMLITLAKSEQEDDKKLLEAVYGIVFFGVPHDGMDISFLIPMVGDGPNRFLVESISRINSQILSIQQRDFHKALRAEGESEIVCFYETMRSPTAKKDENGNWAMSGPLEVLVTKSSATHCRPWEDGPEHICAVARSHSGMVKFRPHDPEYDKACERLRGLARRAVTGRRRRQALNAKFLVPYNKNQDFVGRSNILDDLKQQLDFGQRPGAAGSLPRVALHGLGGVGCVVSFPFHHKRADKRRKTQIALAHVYWLQEACPEVSVFWVHASNAERFRQSFASIAQECQIPGHDDPKMDVLPLVKGWLEKKENGRWLIVLDNADNAQLLFGAIGTSSSSIGKLGQFIPECGHGTVLATTRNKQAAVKLTKSGRIVEVRKMDEKESIELLRTRLMEDDKATSRVTPNELSMLSSRLEYLPLALVQAAAFIRENGVSIELYLGLLSESDQSIVDLLSEEFETIGRDSEAPQAVAQTWMLSFRQIKEQDALAGNYLSLMSLFDRQGIPMSFLSHYSAQERNGGPKSNLELIKSVGLLKAFSLISEEKSGNLDIHRLVQLVTRKWLVNDGKISEFRREALLTVSQMYPFGRFENRTVCSAYLPHANAVLKIEVSGLGDGEKVKASLLHCVASYLDFEGKWSDAEKLSVDAIEARKRVLGEEHPETLSSMANLASTYRNQGRWKEAEELGVRVLEARKRVLGEEHPGTLISMATLASTYRNQGRWKEAEQLEVRVIEVRKRVLGEEHPETLSSMHNLASTYWNQGRWKEAEELGVRVIEARRRVLGEEHPGTLISMQTLASTYRNQGRWKEAEQLEVRVIEVRKRVLGEEHPETLSSMHNLASTYWNQGRWKEAEEVGVRVIEVHKRVLGEEHPWTLSSMHNLASTYWNQGRWKEAEELGVRVIEARRRVLGEEHPGTLISMHNLASTYRNQGRWKEAEEVGVRVIEVHKRVLGEEHPWTLSSMHNLASTYWNQGRWKEAEELGETLISMANLASTYRHQGRWKEAEELGVRVIEVRKRVLGEEHPETLISMSNLASTYRNQGRMANLASKYWDQGRWKEAGELGLEVRKRVLGEEHPGTLISMANLASTYRHQGRWKEAEELGVRVIEVRKRVLGEEHPGTLISMANLASTYRHQGRWKEAEELGVRVKEVHKRVLGEEHPWTLSSMHNLASTYWNQGRWKEAEELGVRVIEGRKRVLGEEHPKTLTSMANLALTYGNQGRWKEAEELGVRVIEVRKRVLGEEHPGTLSSMSNLALTYGNQGRWKEAEELGVRVLEVHKRVLGEENPGTLTSMNNLAWTWYKIDRAVEAKALMQDCIRYRQKILGQDHPDTQSSISAMARWESFLAHLVSFSFVTLRLEIIDAGDGEKKLAKDAEKFSRRCHQRDGEDFDAHNVNGSHSGDGEYRSSSFEEGRGRDDDRVTDNDPVEQPSRKRRKVGRPSATTKYRGKITPSRTSVGVDSSTPARKPTSLSLVVPEPLEWRPCLAPFST
ncbi:hypothetical protein HIM_10908 [Hirsutella minnesotensis 3608]|uniref:DUF676 domain-containing protein n=1 Tax=Hirsutella minnesotensis 3608 TaxID=1043627 RepID=A0A0F7ZWW9_9HYPO|nr:hypothetical protein HIM_10908 [Hirsutella minnesotensis 3608]